MNYTCPYCGHHTTVTDPNRDSRWNRLWVEPSVWGDFGFGVSAITCPNAQCKELKLVGYMTALTSGGNQPPTKLKVWNLLPESEAKVLPSYVPEAVKEDYYEACRIRDLSPKASATLARRCLQGMIRDFYGIVKSRLVDEIKELESKVAPDVWESIEAVRAVGNIGAHMEKDINLIVDVEPDEAQLLLGLIEQLIDDWYVVREERRKRSEALKSLAASKENQKKGEVEVGRIGHK